MIIFLSKIYFKRISKKLAMIISKKNLNFNKMNQIISNNLMIKKIKTMNIKAVRNLKIMIILPKLKLMIILTKIIC